MAEQSPLFYHGLLSAPRTFGDMAINLLVSASSILLPFMICVGSVVPSQPIHHAVWSLHTSSLSWTSFFVASVWLRLDALAHGSLLGFQVHAAIPFFDYPITVISVWMDLGFMAQGLSLGIHQHAASCLTSRQWLGLVTLEWNAWRRVVFVMAIA